MQWVDLNDAASPETSQFLRRLCAFRSRRWQEAADAFVWIYALLAGFAAGAVFTLWFEAATR